MKAIVYTQYSTPDVLRIQEVKKPVPRDDEVLIKVHAASINSWDWDLLRGKPYIVRLIPPGGLLKPRTILGCDVAGRVEEIGSKVENLKPGDEVFGDVSGGGWGCLAEYVCAHENVLALKSPAMSFEEAAAIPQAGILALQGLRDRGKIRRGQKVLINGAGGGVGTFGIQLAKMFGAEVTGVDNTVKLDLMREVGVDHVIDYTKEDFTKNGQHYDLILMIMGSNPLTDYRRSLNTGGRYVMVGGSSRLMFQSIFFGPLLSMMGSKKIGILPHEPRKTDLDYLTELFETRKIKPIIDRSYPLHEVPEAFRYFGEGNVRGKVVITV